MSISPSLDIYSVVATVGPRAINIPTSLTHNLNDKIVEIESLLDCGAGGIFIDQNYA